jgi:NTE family protein
MAQNKQTQKQKNTSGKKSLSLALQGGGAHGAFTWGIIDRILEEDSIEIEAISGTSAGAMNGALVVNGIADGGRDKAREMLEVFWKKISNAASLGPFSPSILDKMVGSNDMMYSPGVMAMEYMTRIFSPSQLNVLDINPFQTILEDVLDMKKIQNCKKIKLFVNATNVLTGKIKVFESKELTTDMLLASACLPFLFKTVEVDGQPYWDGGYSGNPALFPLIYSCDCKDIAIIQINPINIDQVPYTAQDIMDRVNEISFNTTLMREARAIAFVSKLIDDGVLTENAYKNMKLHLIEAEELMADLGHTSKFNADWDFLVHLKEVGRQTAEDWLEKNYDKIGVESSIDVRDYFL